MSGGIATSAYRAIGMRSLAVGFNIEMVRAQQGLLGGAMGVHILPISNYDEMMKLFKMHLNPTDEDRASCLDVKCRPGTILADRCGKRTESGSILSRSP